MRGGGGSSLRRIGVIHGPNLGRLGVREPGVYGTDTLARIDARLDQVAGELEVELVRIQSNHEGELLDWIESVTPRVEGFLVNPGGLTHTSVVLRDSLLASGHPYVEVHLSNTAAREPFRHHSFLADRAVGVVFGFGPESYLLGLRGLVAHLTD